ncbi:ThiF family adenylyltransferase [Methylobacterium oryzihabitans]|uniref:ThiF family adenylyltransferase n=1 Tax=Methylobacterium oryzihabitans TaxID=2499852 RepID=UPI001AEECCDB|nr:ThiF family adenylyltransferase [Methylobacterium oryzihabitans]
MRERAGQVPERLDAATIASDYPTRDWIAAGWRISVAFSDGVTRRLDLLAGRHFPTTPVRTALVDHPEAMTWPHVESDGVLCLLPNTAEWDPDHPSAVALGLLHRSITLIEELLEGGIIERDFREEFVTYWGYKAHSEGKTLFSLIAPTPPSRLVRVWRSKGLEVIGEDQESLAAWVYHRFGDKTPVNTEAAAFLWLDTPPLPADYPETAADLHRMAERIGEDAKTALEEVAGHEPDEVLTLLGAIGRGGAALIGVKAPNPKRRKSRPCAPDEPLSAGFRPRHTPHPLLQRRFFGALAVVRTQVQRADAEWVHGRGQDPRTRRLLGATVVIVGCGSVGAPVACALVQAGVGRTVLVDPETLGWPNVGRHPLGAADVGRNKAEALAERLRTDYPHLTVEHRSYSLHQMIATEGDLLAAADLIVAATGNWVAESTLNRWHVAQGREKPVLYGWTEAHACAGHAVAIGGEDGCLQCHIGRTGAPDLTVIAWPEGGDARLEEPACGAHYQPYGPVELAYVTAMIADAAMDCLLDPPARSFSRVSVASPRRIAALGGQLTEGWLSAFGEVEEGGRTVDRSWPSVSCTACKPERIDESA